MGYRLLLDVSFTRDSAGKGLRESMIQRVNFGIEDVEKARGEILVLLDAPGNKLLDLALYKQ